MLFEWLLTPLLPKWTLGTQMPLLMMSYWCHDANTNVLVPSIVMAPPRKTVPKNQIIPTNGSRDITIFVSPCFSDHDSYKLLLQCLCLLCQLQHLIHLHLSFAKPPSMCHSAHMTGTHLTRYTSLDCSRVMLWFNIVWYNLKTKTIWSLNIIKLNIIKINIILWTFILHVDTPVQT